MDDKIDFVITWVDGNDPQWRKERSQYTETAESDNREFRYRDWDNLQYWFRGIEKFAPWVNNIYFLTWGHLPVWLNTKHPKLKIVKHQDFIPSKYLPTYNSNSIELNMHRIEGLEEQFVYFNDDMFLCDKTSSEDFFIKGKPRDSAIMTIHCYNLEVYIMSHIRNIGFINEYVDMKSAVRNKPSNWFNWRYGKYNMRNILLYAICPRFPGFYITHLPSNFLKSTINELWDKEQAALDETCSHRFRCIQDINQWIFKDMQVARNCFVPQKPTFGKSFSAIKTKEVTDYIRLQKGKIISINDNDMSDENFEFAKNKIINAFETILPRKSKFEL